MKLGTVGQSVPGVEVKLASDGEVLVRGSIVMKGYWQRPEETAKVLRLRWMVSYRRHRLLDEDGYLSIIDRKREILVLATGKNVAPQAVENAMKCIPFVMSACAIGDRKRFTAALVTYRPQCNRSVPRVAGNAFHRRSTRRPNHARRVHKRNVWPLQL